MIAEHFLLPDFLLWLLPRSTFSDIKYVVSVNFVYTGKRMHLNDKYSSLKVCWCEVRIKFKTYVRINLFVFKMSPNSLFTEKDALFITPVLRYNRGKWQAVQM